MRCANDHCSVLASRIGATDAALGARLAAVMRIGWTGTSSLRPRRVVGTAARPELETERERAVQAVLV